MIFGRFFDAFCHLFEAKRPLRINAKTDHDFWLIFDEL